MALSDLNQFMTGHKEKWELNISKLSSHIFRIHKKEVLDETASSYHPNPWKWSRLFVSLIGLSILLLLAVLALGLIPYPWLSLIVASIIPISLMLFLYEFSAHTQISIKNLVIIFFVGSALSFLAIWFLSFATGLPFLDMTIAVIVEEIAKGIPILLAIRLLKIKRLSSALLVGWTIGAGFDIAETLGYSSITGVTIFLLNGTLDFSPIFVRLLSAFNSHSLWGAILGGAIIMSLREDGKRFHYGRLSIWFSIPIILHFLNNVISNYVVSIGWSIVLLLILQIIAIPIFIYILDCGVRDQKRNFPYNDAPQVVIENEDQNIQPDNN